jgi:endogenous inhibitor of DNA gyrase (YacG/DUF329 family)
MELLMMERQLKCPQCQKITSWQENPHRPFCSERCQLLDLSQWADESFRIAGPSQEFSFDDDENKTIQ